MVTGDGSLCSWQRPSSFNACMTDGGVVCWQGDAEIGKGAAVNYMHSFSIGEVWQQACVYCRCSGAIYSLHLIILIINNNNE